jgi:5-formyltetrahydrofolate cyclo-ligase
MKADLRAHLLKQRLALTQQQVAQGSKKIIDQIRALPAYQQANVIGLYMPIKNEPDLHALYHDSKRILLPKVIGQDLIYVHWSLEYQLVKSPLGILEPPGNEDESRTLDLMIIPSLALDNKGNRLGFGKGYFDRFLSQQRPRLVIGVIYAFQKIDQLITTDLDMPVDLVIVG